MRKEFVKYFIVGITSFVIDMSLLISLKEYAHLPATLAVVIDQCIIIGYNFLLNKYWSFRNRAMPHWQFIRYILLFTFNFFVSVLAMHVFHDRIGFDYRLVRIGTIAIMVSYNFLLYKFWVYKHESSGVDADKQMRQGNQIS